MLSKWLKKVIINIMASVRRVVYLVSTGLMSVMFGFAGIAKLTPIIGQEIYNAMV